MIAVAVLCALSIASAVGISLEVFRAGAGDSVVPDVAD